MLGESNVENDAPVPFLTPPTLEATGCCSHLPFTTSWSRAADLQENHPEGSSPGLSARQKSAPRVSSLV